MLLLEIFIKLNLNLNNLVYLLDIKKLYNTLIILKI